RGGSLQQLLALTRIRFCVCQRRHQPRGRSSGVPAIQRMAHRFVAAALERQDPVEALARAARIPDAIGTVRTVRVVAVQEILVGAEMLSERLGAAWSVQ